MRGDVGRPITDIASDLDFPGLADQAREVLRTLLSHEQQVATRDGRWFMMRIMPYRTLENMIDGVVMTFVDITVSKTLEAELRKTQADLYQQIGEQSPKPEPYGSPKTQTEATPGLPETKASSLKR
jgi:two-component system CheB/CheR fusion protein